MHPAEWIMFLTINVYLVFRVWISLRDWFNFEIKGIAPFCFYLLALSAYDFYTYYIFVLAE